ncbi:uncharacterized protein PG986_004907 [Apiospora aurea]|uniref:Fungal calcium binding protein domain-containing protein n=1 Tax=Apiospora aurea TaxID=335848 RepID=A0ABR1QG29_9PEZI
MRFSAATVVAVLASQALASPVAPVNPFAGDVATKSNETAVEEAILFAIRPQADCDIGNCAGILAAAACIALGIVKRNPADVIGCVSGGAESLCGCITCVPGLGDFLNDNGLCPS